MKKWSLEFALVIRPVCPGLFKPDAPTLPPPQKKEFKPTSWLSGHKKPNLFLRIRFWSPTNTVNFRLQFDKGVLGGLIKDVETEGRVGGGVVGGYNRVKTKAKKKRYLKTLTTLQNG